MHTRPIVVQGIFTSDKKKSELKCLSCSSDDVWYRIWESECGGYEDYKYECSSCGKVWWVEGSDA